MKIGSKWTDGNGNVFVVASIQDGVVFYINNRSTYSCLVDAFLARFNELVQ